MNCTESPIVDIHFKNFGIFTEKHLFWLSTSLKIDEEVLHTNTLKEWNFLDNNSIYLLK